jgi:hypothetical protein
MDYVAQNLPENLEEERRRLAHQIGRTLLDNEYLLSLQWAELLLSLELRLRYPKPLVILVELGLRLLVGGITLISHTLKNNATVLRDLCR